MLKKYLKIGIVGFVLLGILIFISVNLSNYRLNKYRDSVVNNLVYKNNQIDKVFENSDNDLAYLFLYDPNDDDCIYLDEVLLKQLSYDHNGIRFDQIYKITYEQSYRSYIQQLIRNTYSISSFPAIVAVKKTEDGFEKVDSFEYTVDQKRNADQLNKFLERNHFYEISQKD